MVSLRIKELCKERHVSMTELAEKIGITLVALSQSLNGNPTLSRLQEVANALGVDVVDLFNRQTDNIYGCIFVNGSPNPVYSREDIDNLLKRL